MRAWENHETIEEYLARGGKVTKCDDSDAVPRKPAPEYESKRSLSLKRNVARNVIKRKGGGQCATEG